MAKNTVILKDYLKIREEYEAAAAITPGYLIEMTSAGKVQAHSSAGQNMIHMFALEDELQGNGISDAYSSGDQVQCWIPQRGDQVYALLDDGESVTKGDFLESAGNGNLQKYTADTEAIGVNSSGNVESIYTNQIVGIALETVDLSGSSGEESSALQGDQRIKVRIV